MGRLLYSWELGTHAISALQTCNIDNENKVTKINGKSMHEEDNLICNFFFFQICILRLRKFFFEIPREKIPVENISLIRKPQQSGNNFLKETTAPKGHKNSMPAKTILL